jgi:Zn-dependent protease
MANFVMAFLWLMLLRLALPGAMWASNGLLEMARYGVGVNLALMALNLLPIPPLDGGRIAVGLLPGRAAYTLSRVEPYGFMIILLLLVVGFLDDLMRPIMRAAEYVLSALSVF